MDTVSVAGGRRITYDARGLAEPDAEVPKISEVDGGTAVFDAANLTTRQINLELRWLLYEQGITDVTVQTRAPSTRSASGSCSAAGSASRAAWATSGAG